METLLNVDKLVKYYLPREDHFVTSSYSHILQIMEENLKVIIQKESPPL